MDGDEDIVLTGVTYPPEPFVAAREGLILLNDGNFSFSVARGDRPSSVHARDILMEDFDKFVNKETGEVICMRNMRRDFVNEYHDIKNIDLYIKRGEMICPVVRMSRRVSDCLDCFISNRWR